MSMQYRFVAVGHGRLTATSGSGTWRGAMCSGTWTAQ